jgi:hypothetical protein
MDLTAAHTAARTSIAATLRRWAIANATPLAIFAVTRIGLFLLAYLSLLLLPREWGEQWRAYPDNLFLDGWARWDSGWFNNIAQSGYTNVPQESGQTDVAFFPLYPLLMRVVGAVVGDTYLAGMIISNVAFLLALIVLYRLVSDLHNPEIAKRSVILLAVFPFAFHYSAVYSEALFLLAVVCAFYFGEKRRWLLASLCAAIAGATRTVGAITVLGLLVLYLEQIRFDVRKLRLDILWLPLGLLGIGGYMAFLWLRFGDPLVFATAQYVEGWKAGIDWGLATRVLRDAMSPRRWIAGQIPGRELFDLLTFFGALGLSLVGVILERPRLAYGVWALVMTLASFSGWVDMTRLVIVIFPLFILVALALKRDALFNAVVYVSTLLLALFTAIFALAYWF